jgi:hypothetical protein
MNTRNRLWPRLVRRTSAPRLVLDVLIAFGATVLLVRLFLELTGYPRLGGATLHIAHMLYGGIALSAAALLMLIYATPTVNRIAAILTGIGLGLFFDEIGKFITANNDYFYRPAAPIIYIISLIIALLLYLLRRRQAKPTDAELMVSALENAELLLEGQQTEQQHRMIDAELDRIIATMRDPDYVQLAHALRQFADSETVLPGHTRLQMIKQRIEQWLLGNFMHHQMLFTRLMIVLLAINSIGSLLTFTVALVAPAAAPELARQIERLYIETGLRAFSPFKLSIDSADLLLNFVTATLTLYGITLFVSGRKQHGLYWIQLTLILQLCVVNVFTFYVEQFSAALLTLADLGILLYVRTYQHQLKQAAMNRLAASVPPSLLNTSSATTQRNPTTR